MTTQRPPPTMQRPPRPRPIRHPGALSHPDDQTRRHTPKGAQRTSPRPGAGDLGYPGSGVRGRAFCDVDRGLRDGDFGNQSPLSTEDQLGRLHRADPRVLAADRSRRRGCAPTWRAAELAPGLENSGARSHSPAAIGQEFFDFVGEWNEAGRSAAGGASPHSAGISEQPVVRRRFLLRLVGSVMARPAAVGYRRKGSPPGPRGSGQ